MKTLAPGESLATPPATLACVHGTLDDLCDRLTAIQQRAVDTQPEVEQDLPVVFNEWCTTWGDPQHDKVVAIADRLRGTATRYLVIDAGWYRPGAASWDGAHGDWIPSAQLFPQGLEATAAAIRERGLIPGLWFEMESVGENSTAFSLVDHMLQRDGIPVTVRERRFWNLNDPWVVDYLTERVIDLLDRCGFGYLKVDYNETIGPGCDDPDSPGEGLRRQVLASYRFFEKIRERLPNLVIENCASGGHRLEPSMLARTAMSSFSDAHELVEIPIIAASLHQLVLPRQSQIWAVLHRSDSMQRLAYSLAATFLGRMCLSGEIAELTGTQWKRVLEAERPVSSGSADYQTRGPAGASASWAKAGVTRAAGRQWFAGARMGRQRLWSSTHSTMLRRRSKCPAGSGDWKIEHVFSEADATIANGRLQWAPPGNFSACVALLSHA